MLKLYAVLCPLHFLKPLGVLGAYCLMGYVQHLSGLICSEDPKYSRIYIYVKKTNFLYLRASLLAEEKCGFFHHEETKIQFQFSMHKLELMM